MLDTEAKMFQSSTVQVAEACLHSKGRSVGCVLMTLFAKAIGEMSQGHAMLNFSLGLE